MDHFDPLVLHQSLPKPPSTPDMISPTLSHQQHVQSPAQASSSDAHLTQAQAASMRRKKNADAQAAFRARRANYIASLEETVTSLEAVVLSLQDTCREARNDADDLRHEHSRLLSVIEAMKQAARDREKQWRDFWHSKQQALGLDESHMNDFPPRACGTPPTAELHPSGLNSRHYVDEALRFQPNSHPPYALAPGKDTDQRYPSSLQPFTTNPEGNWIPGPFSNTRTPCIGDPHPSHSSEASDSPPSISPIVQYGARFPLPTDENRMSLVNLSMPNTPYGRDFRSASAPSFVSDMLYSLPESGSLAVPDYGSDGYQGRQHALSEGERYTGRPRRSYSGPNPRGGDMYATDGARVSSPTLMAPGESDGLNGESLHPGDVSHMRPRRHTSASLMHGGSAGALATTHSRSSSPSPRDRDREPPMSNTLAVIKAQAFGSLRRTRMRTKKVPETGSKVAIDILCTRGIGMGVQSAPAPSHTLGNIHRQSRRKCDLDDVEMTS